MNTKFTFTAIVAAATLATAGFAVAQTSTPGAGCTATANAMRGGNLGGSATNKDCVSSPASTAAMPAPATTTSTPMAAPAPSTNAAVMSDSSTVASATPTRTRTRSAKADRN